MARTSAAGFETKVNTTPAPNLSLDDEIQQTPRRILEGNGSCNCCAKNGVSNAASVAGL